MTTPLFLSQRLDPIMFVSLLAQLGSRIAKAAFETLFPNVHFAEHVNAAITTTKELFPTPVVVVDCAHPNRESVGLRSRKSRQFFFIDKIGSDRRQRFLCSLSRIKSFEIT
ncbi:MAG: hypothetical protein GY820_20080 [Gammaproteobacteria bacterium]|nr:hypothetical protein [Gammaproteobacteria bacterium]